MFTDQEKGRILSPSTSMFRSQLVPICENLTCSGSLQCLLAWHGRIYIPGNQQMLHMIFFFFELVYWPYKLTLLFLTVEILDDARIQILESFTVAEAEVSPPFLIYWHKPQWELFLSFTSQFFFQGHAFKKVVFAVYICGNVTFLIIFLSAINQLWASKDLGFCRPDDNDH